MYPIESDISDLYWI